MFKSKIALLIGAGASRPVDIPAMRGLASSFRQSLPKGGDVYETYKLIRSFDVSEDVEEILQTIKLIREYHNSPLKGYVEHAISPTGSSSTLEKIDERIEQNFEAICDLEESLLDHIREKCFNFDRNTAELIYSGLIEVLEDRSIPVFTTNYDFVLEHVAAQRGFDIVDNFVRNGRGRNFWDPKLEAFRGEGFRIVKIHGSLQWYVDDTGRIEKIAFRAEMNPEGRRLEDLVIFPTRFKDIYERNYFALYSVFLRSLETVDLLFIVGHSLRDEYIRAAVRERVRQGDITVVVVDPGDPKLEDIKNAASTGNPGSEVVQYRWKFEEVSPLLADCLDRVGRDKIVEYLSDADQTLTRRRVRYDEVELVTAPQWVSPGETLELNVRGDVTVGGGSFKVWLDVGREPSNRIELNWEEIGPSSGELRGIIRGNRALETTIKVSMPVDLPRKGHTLGVGLVVGSVDEGHNVVSEEYRIRTRKD